MLEVPFDPGGAIVVTGSTGFVGRAIVDVLRQSTRAPLVLPVRANHSPDRVLHCWDGDSRLCVLAVDTADDPSAIAARLRRHAVTTIVHAAGSCHYTNVSELTRGNEQLTQFWLETGCELGVQRFVYISTAFSGGWQEGLIPERLHGDWPGVDLTPYMRSKRETEQLVAASGLPCLIVRPSILIGDSRTGEYHGKLYGLYQLWAAAQRWLTADDLDAVAELLGDAGPLPILHIDLFQQVLLAALQYLPAGSVMHLVAPENELPRVRHIVDRWMRSLAADRRQPRHPSADSRLRRWAAYSRFNLSIAQRRWQFSHDWLDKLAGRLPRRPQVSMDSLLVCQDWFRRHRLPPSTHAGPDTPDASASCRAALPSQSQG